MTANQPEPDTGAEAPKGRIPADTFANRLLLARAQAGHLSIREAALATGLNREAWRDWEHGRLPRDILDVCRRIAAALEIDHDWLLFGGPLAGPRGMPTKARTRRADGSGTLPAGYPGRPHSRPLPPPKGRAVEGPRPGQPPRPEQRRPVRISRPHAA